MSGPRPVPLFEKFLLEETPLVSQEMSFKCDDIDNVHRPPPKFSHQIYKNLKDQLSEKVGGGDKSPHSPLGSATGHPNFQDICYFINAIQNFILC